MQLHLSVIGPEAEALGDAAAISWTDGGGTIGRAANNDWTLPDPDQEISRYHARVRFAGDGFYLQDTSANGVFLNDRTTRLNAAEAHRLRDGERLFIGGYQILVRIDEKAVGAAASPPPASWQPAGEGALDPRELLGGPMSPEPEDPPIPSGTGSPGYLEEGFEPPRPRSAASPLRGRFAISLRPYLRRLEESAAPPPFPQPSEYSSPPAPEFEPFDAQRVGARGPAPGDRAAATEGPPAPQPKASESEASPTRTDEPKAEKASRLTLSAETAGELAIKSVGLVDYRIELAVTAKPLAQAFSAETHLKEDIRVVATADGEAFEMLGGRVHNQPFPTADRPSIGTFEIQPLNEGSGRVAISFRQGGTELGIVTLLVCVVSKTVSRATSAGKAAARAREPADDEMLELLIETRATKDAGGDQTLYFEYKLNSVAHEFNYLTVKSRPLLAGDGSPARNIIKYVQKIYEKVTPELKDRQDLRRLERSLRAVGIDLCEELFEPEVTRELWPIRDKLSVIKLTTWEPYIPWELVRLANPVTREVDNKFLCEYGLIRADSGRMPPAELRLNRWAFLAAEYPHNSFPSIGSEVDYFRCDLPSQGIHPTRFPSDYDVFFAALNKGDFDVLHIACHAKSEHDDPKSARLVIGEREVPALGRTKFEAVEIFPDELKAEVRYSGRFAGSQPLVFLNGCETGRAGPQLSNWGGWPSVFLSAGASVFVGTSWEVHDKPAAAFAKAFYDTLRAEETLVAAARAARQAAKNKFGDHSWLAFKVYGNPNARQRTMR